MSMIVELRYRTASALALLGLVVSSGPAAAQHVFPSGGGFVSGSHSGIVVVGQSIAGSASSAGASADVGFGPASNASGPTGVVNASLAVAGQSVTVTATLADPEGVDSAVLYHRVGGTAAYVMTPMSLSAPLTWSAQIPAADVTVKGVQWYVIASDGTNESQFPPGAPTTVVFSLPVQVTNHQAFSLAVNAYALLGVPLVANDPSPTAVFDEFGGAFNDAVWKYGTFNGTSYDSGAAAAPATVGQGFWVAANIATGINVSGISSDLSDDIAIKLHPGFNQIATPVAFAVDWSNVTLPANVENNLIGWNGTGYTMNVIQMQPATGYWLKNNGVADEFIQVSPLGPGVTSRPGFRGTVALGDDEPGWSIMASATVGDYADTDNRFGMRLSATELQDAFDFSEPPPPPAGFVSMWFRDPQGEARVSDYRGMSEGGVWTLDFISDRAGEDYRIEFEVERELPEGWSIVAFEMGTGLHYDLGALPVLTGTLGSGTTSKSWRLAVGPTEFVDRETRDVVSQVTHFALANVFPNPAGVGQRIAFDVQIPVDTRVLLQLFDLQGRIVQTLHDGQLRAGAHRFTWQGAGPGGNRVAAGVYFVRMKSPHYTTSRKVLVAD